MKNARRRGEILKQKVPPRGYHTTSMKLIKNNVTANGIKLSVSIFSFFLPFFRGLSVPSPNDMFAGKVENPSSNPRFVAQLMQEKGLFIS